MFYISQEIFCKNTDNEVDPSSSSKDVKENSALKLQRKVKVLAKRQSHRHVTVTWSPYLST